MSSDRKKQQQLHEARQAGTVAPEVDVKTGQMINPHNPEFITKRPWYLAGDGQVDTGPSLDHQGDQRLESERRERTLLVADALLQRERAKLSSSKKAFRVGMWVEALKQGRAPYRICQIKAIHKNGTQFDLEYEDGTLERKVRFRPNNGKPRIRMTKAGNRAFDVDASQFGKETYDSKRDQYHGYDANTTHMKRMEEKFSRREELRQKHRQSAKEQQNNKDDKNSSSRKDNDKASASDFDDSDLDSDNDDDSDDEEFAQRDGERTFQSRVARQGGLGGAQMKVTARNLRIREDTAKYLYNLDIDSAYYDPKSRSMRDNPLPQQTDVAFAGDNFARTTGDAIGHAETQVFAWDATGGGATKEAPSVIHPQANPSQTEILKKQFKSKMTNLKANQKKALLDKYGGGEYLDGSDGLATALSEKKGQNESNNNNNTAERSVRFGVSVTQEEYAADGRRLGAGGNNSSVPTEPLPSKYQEDVFVNGHSTVWGSYFHRGAFRWGYADDHSLIRNSYCTGKAGQKLNDEQNEMQYGTGVAGSTMLAQARDLLKSIPSGNNNNNNDDNKKRKAQE